VEEEGEESRRCQSSRSRNQGREGGLIIILRNHKKKQCNAQADTKEEQHGEPSSSKIVLRVGSVLGGRVGRKKTNNRYRAITGCV